MHNRVFGAALFCIVVFLIPTVTHAQKFGFEAGGSYDYQSGSFVAPCGCTFAHGVGYGFGAAISYDITSSYNFTSGLKSGVEEQATASPEVFPGNISSRIANGDEQDVKLLYLFVDPLRSVQRCRHEIFSSGIAGVQLSCLE